ncbi:MAG: hypothetical protein NUV91_09460 [Candidatus Omnitrophica bacterium]|nr:hypothetical protein [Candidatus Omnitrophota bacterium]
MNHYGIFLLRISLCIIFIWFGLLKIFGLSPVNKLVAHTVYWFEPHIFIPLLGWWEVLIGVCFFIRPFNRMAVFLLVLQMGGTFLTLVILPEVCFKFPPFVLTMEGEFIIKNFVILSAALVIGGVEKLPSKVKRDMKL